MENDVLKAIKERRSIRRFKADQITDEELKTVLEAWHLGCNRTWHPETIYRCRTEHGNMRPTAQDERRGDGSGERPLLWRTYHCHRPGPLRRGEQRERRKPHPWQHDACRPLHRACLMLDKP